MSKILKYIYIKSQYASSILNHRYCGVSGGFWFAGIHMLQMYYKTHVDELPEEGFTGETHTDLRTFATLMIEGGEILLIICVTFLNLVFCWRDKIFIYLFNQLIDYNKKLSGKLLIVLFIYFLFISSCILFKLLCFLIR